MIDISTIKMLTRKLASMNIKEYHTLIEVKNDFDNIASEFTDLVTFDKAIPKILTSASSYFNLISEEDFSTTDRARINEFKAVISKLTKELNSLLIQWRKEHNHF